MDNDYQVADIPSDCVEEINQLQDKLKQQTNEDIVLVAYKPADE